MRRRRRLLLALLAVSSLTGAANAAAADVAVVAVDPFDPARFAGRGAVGLVVPGWGEEVSRERAVAALVRGSVRSSLVDRDVGGAPLIDLRRTPGRVVTIYVALPPPGRSVNDERFPVAIVGGGYRGVLTSPSTRIRGLVAITDIAPTAVALEAEEAPRIAWSPEPRPAAALAALDGRLAAARSARKAVMVAVISWIPLLAFLAWVLRSAWVARAALLAAPVTLLLSLTLSALEIESLRLLAGLHAALIGPLALLAARHARSLPVAVTGAVAVYCVVLVAATEVASLAALGPQPTSGGRFYGTTNKIETLLLAPVVGACAAAGGALAVALAAASLFTVGWSRAGADGGGLVVFGVAFATLALLTRVARLTPRRLLAAATAVAVGSACLVLLDAATGGQSHVTGAVVDRPGGIGSTIVDRLRLSWAGLTDSGDAIAVSLIGALGLLAAAVVGRGRPVVVALLAGFAVSLVVNDTAVDVLLYGVLGAFALVVWDRVRPAVA